MQPLRSAADGQLSYGPQGQEIRLLLLPRAMYPFVSYRCRGARFASHLANLAPDQAILRVTPHAVQRVWRERHEAERREALSLADRKDRLRREREQVTRAFLYERQIDRSVFDAEIQRIASQEADAEERLRQLETGGMEDTETLLQFAETLVSAPHRWWKDSEPHQRAVLQQVFFPAGIPYGPDGSGTAETCPFFRAEGGR